MQSRSQAIEALKREQFDVLVIGGGITGVGVALDAASRGYSVALVEKGDYAIGTSSRSSKLVHGGLRYLKNFDIAVVRESLLERQLMVKLAPHLVKPLAMIVAAFNDEHPDRIVGVGLNAYDLMSIDRLRRPGSKDGEHQPYTEWTPDRHRTIDAEAVLTAVPALADKKPTSGYLFYDCQTDDVRLVLTVLQEAVRFGAVCANRTAVVKEVLNDQGIICGVEVEDQEAEETFSVQAKTVVNATGVWADKVIDNAMVSKHGRMQIRPSRGTHILFAREKLPVNEGVIVPVGDGRSIFVLPWLGRTLVGTTDNDYQGSIEEIAPGKDDVTYILDAVNTYFGSTLNEQDICGAYAGVRPLISSGNESNSTDVSRRAELYQADNGLITITGGKLTTWRQMAKDAVDCLVEREGRELECRTDQIPLGLAIKPEDLAKSERELSIESYTHLADRYGSAAHRVVKLINSNPELAEAIVSPLPDPLAEIVYACRYEQALHIDDVLLRRTRLGLLAARELQADNGSRIRVVADLMAKELGWDDKSRDREIKRFYTVAAAEGVLLDIKPSNTPSIADNS